MTLIDLKNAGALSLIALIAWQYAARPVYAQQPRQVAALVKNLDQADAAQRIRSIKALGKLGAQSKSAVMSLIARLNDDSPVSGGKTATVEEKTAVLETLAAIGPSARESLPYLAALLEDKNLFFRRPQIITCIEAIGPDGSTTASLIRIVNEEARYTKGRHQAIRMLGQIDPPAQAALPLLRTIAREETDAVARDSAKAALSKIEIAMAKGHYQSTSAITAELTDTQPLTSRLAALQEIEKKGPQSKDMVPVLIGLLHDRNPSIKDQAVATLGAIGPAASAAVPVLVRESLFELNTEKRQRTFGAIAKIDPTARYTIPIIGPALEDPFKARNAIELLDTIGGSETKSLSKAAKARWKMR